VKKTKVTLGAVRAVLQKWREHHTIQDLPKTGRHSKLNDRKQRQLARKVLRGEVESATKLAQSAAAQGIADVSATTVRKSLHHQGMKAMHTINKPHLTHEHKRKRMEFARSHGDWTIEKWKQVIFSDETGIVARPSDAHKLRWVKKMQGLNPRLVVPIVQSGGVSILIWGCISNHGLHDLVLLGGKLTGLSYIKVLYQHLLPVVQEYFPRPSIDIPAR
jgi:transposase